MTDLQQPYTGDPCPRPSCGGTLVRYDSRVIDGTELRRMYYRCNCCGARPVNNKRVEVDARMVRRGIIHQG